MRVVTVVVDGIADARDRCTGNRRRRLARRRRQQKERDDARRRSLGEKVDSDDSAESPQKIQTLPKLGESAVSGLGLPNSPTASSAIGGGARAMPPTKKKKT